MKKGISLVSLIITIIVLVIFTAIIVIDGTDAYEAATINMFASEISNIQTLVDEYYMRNNAYPIKESVVLKASDLTSNGLEQFASEEVINNEINLKIIDLSLIGINKTEFGNNIEEDDLYVLSETSGKVYYLLGIEFQGEIYYSLTDKLYQIMRVSNISNVVLNENEIKRYDLIISLNNMEYTKEPVIVTLKIPKDATYNKVTSTNGKSVSGVGVINGYNVITINETSLDKNGNYDIDILYTYQDKQKNVKYSIVNFDNIKPTISYSVESNEANKTITVQAADDESGINNIKYDLSEVTNIEYFKNYGKKLNGDKIILSKESKCTLYVEDKAGNTNMVVVENE